MKRTIMLLVILLCGMVARAGAGSDFDKMKALVGEWDATSPEGKYRITFQLISEGTALMESVSPANMVTVYHPDGDSIMMTHYCAVGNQPRMRARSSQGDSIAFKFLDVANLKPVADSHMQGLVIKFIDKDHVIEEWTSKSGGKETVSVFDLKRVK